MNKNIDMAAEKSNTQEELISVVVPVYRVEQYLDRCVSSIVHQTYENLQIILVDDGSPDRCPEMCDQWAQRDSRIQVIHKENGGLSDARNVGMKNANGTYIAFVDSDDWIEPEMYELMHKRMIETESDIVSCGAVRTWDDRRKCISMIKCNEEVVLTKLEAMQALIQSSFLIQTVWNKLYKSEITRELPFEVGKIHEDEFWSWKAIAKADRVSTINENYYHYTQRTDSIMGGGHTTKPMAMIEAKKERNDFIRENMPELLDIDSVDLINTCYHYGCQIIKNKEPVCKERLIITIYETCRRCKISHQFLEKQPFKERIRLIIIRCALPLACWIGAHRGVA